MYLPKYYIYCIDNRHIRPITKQLYRELEKFDKIICDRLISTYNP